ncbi:MAG TPA: hypothetical protein VIY28_17775 [Pseudonocardiaceae bacterium]
MASNDAGKTIRAWEDDPGAPPNNRTPIPRPLPEMDRKPLSVGIRGAVPAAGSDAVGSAEFRYWTAAEALRRGADLWGAVVPNTTSWHSTVGPVLLAGLDEGRDFNAFYDRHGLSFFHGTAAGVTVFSGESADVVCHELGHAVLDAIRPQLWDTASAEVAAFHESFGDMSALLSALQLDSFRNKVLMETGGGLSQSSSLSRLAEQLGWAIRQRAPQAVDPDCLRNAANDFFYHDPVTLRSNAPASQLSSEPHSFSRVFTGAFLRILAGIFQAQQTSDSAGLDQASADAGQLLVHAILEAPVVPGYYSQVAAHMIAADDALFNGRYGPALRSAFVRHGVLSPVAATSLTSEEIAPHRDAMAAAATPGVQPALPEIRISGEQYGITGSFTVQVPGQPARFRVAGAAPDIGSLEPGNGERVATSFVEDLFRQGRVQVATAMRTAVALVDEQTVKTHEITEQNGAQRLIRRLFD